MAHLGIKGKTVVLIMMRVSLNELVEVENGWLGGVVQQ